MNCRKDFVSGGILQNVVEKYFDPQTVEYESYCYFVNTWLWNVAYADPGLLRKMRVEWPKDESHGTKKWSAGMYQAAMIHPPCIILTLIETQTIFYHVELRG